MGDERYYRDAPRFKRRDPLATWSYIFLAMAVGAVLWLVLIFMLTSAGLVAGAPDSAFGLTRTAWITITLMLLGASIVGLLFTIFARLGTTEGGTYLTTIDEPAVSARPGQTTRPSPPPAAVHEPVAPAPEPEPPESGGEAAWAGRPHAAQLVARSTARLETTDGPDGRILLSYTIPEDQPRGLYADTYVPVDSDAVLNIKTLLAKTPTV